MNEGSKLKFSDDYIKENGIFFTPDNLSNYVAWKIINYISETTKKTNLKQLFNHLKVIDPACGDGNLLVSIKETMENFSEFKINSPEKIFYGIDINKKLILKSKERIFRNKNFQHNFLVTNALLPNGNLNTWRSWQDLKTEFGAQKGFDILIANPPWGADLTCYKDKLKQNFSLALGQYDSYDLFIELALYIVKHGGYLAFIIPDSLFNKEKSSLRKILLQKTEILLIARLGEKIFKKINRGCAVIIARKKKPSKNNSTVCFRLTKQTREQINNSRITFIDAEKVLSHKVKQYRFYKNSDYLFNIDLNSNEEKAIRILQDQYTFGKIANSARGIELSKNGKVVKCNKCMLWLPYPCSKEPICPHCSSSLNLTKLERDIIIKDFKFCKSAVPLIVGENISRYALSINKYVLLDRNGVNYKDYKIYKGPKILVRKTGVGIVASIDYTNSMTNQVVYILKLKETCPKNITIELLLAILNSRVLYYFLIKNHGEIEWRSHPYLTQSQILNFPLPKLIFSSSYNVTIQRITKLIRCSLKKSYAIPKNIDAKIEQLIAELFGLSEKDYEIIFNTIYKSEELLPVKALKNISLTDIFNYGI